EKKKKRGERVDKETQANAKSEWVKFGNHTRKGMENLLDNYVTNLYHASKEADGMETLKAQPHAETIMKVLLEERDADGKATKIELNGYADSDNKLRSNIKKMLDTPAGWVMAKALLDQQMALQLFATGFALMSDPVSDRGTLGEALEGHLRRQYVSGESGVHKFDRRAAQFAQDHKKGLGVTAALLTAAGS